jgi:hypothetical protein
VPFLRLSRDRRGYESTFLLHARQPGERPRVLYWYRTAPGVRVGRPALDEDAIRTIEEQHADIEFDWAHILEVGAAAALLEAERTAPPGREDRSDSRRRKLPRPKPERPAAEEPGDAIAHDTAPAASTEACPAEDAAVEEAAIEEGSAPAAPRAHDLLEELVGREIATRLHARYAELTSRIGRLPVDELTRDAWRTRAEAINPDNWVTPDEVLSGVQQADSLFDEMRRELPI